ncbi:type II secretion system protein N [Sphingomonas sp. Leaf4]|uniref:type II secretion system protein N n=1 Tax=Sphingomonas sp. Leaf4 TaxID=2876553 RepID=UPI001E5B6A97|nr:type II secretion system protein N [Sphingomonas sp. Leaf4]
MPGLSRSQARRRSIAFATLGIVSFAIAMVATLPASLIVRNVAWRSGVGGTIWHGEVGVAGGSRLEWRFAPLRSLTSLGFAVDWTATGPDTDLGGQAIAWGSGVQLDKVAGSADASLLQALQPDLPFTCDATMQIDLSKLSTASGSAMADGRVAIDPGSCATRAGIATPTPALLLTAEHIGQETRVRLAPDAQRRRTLMDATLREDGVLKFQMTGDGAATLPFVGLPAGAAVEGRF